MVGSVSRLLRRVATSYVLFVVIGVVVGAAIAPVAWQAASAPDGTVAVVPVGGTIDGTTAAEYASMMRQAREDDDIKAVVIVANSGGGAASASETMYLQTKRTAEEMPVVTSVDATAASGAYYTVAPSDYIYAKPSSIVGSVGVLATLPTDVEPNDIVATTGPNKLTGGDEREFFAVLESLRRAFVRSVYEGRGDALELSRAQLAEAQIYSGGQAVEYGLADEIGDEQAAIEDAAERAGLSNYRIEVLRPQDQRVRFVSRSNYLASDAPNKEMVDATYLVGDRTGPPVFLMMPASYLASTDGMTAVDASAAGTSPGSNARSPGSSARSPGSNASTASAQTDVVPTEVKARAT